MLSASRIELPRRRKARPPLLPPAIPLMTPSNPPEEITAIASVAPVPTPGTVPGAAPGAALDTANPTAIVVEDEEPGGAMTFFEHLTELRKRIMNSLIAHGGGRGHRRVRFPNI